LVNSWIASFDNLQIGDNETIKKIRLRIGAGEMGDAEMLIGADFFLSHRVYVANSERKMFLTYAGGPVFSLTSDLPPAVSAAANVNVPSGPEPTDADGYSRRAQVAAARRDFPRAIADLSRAIDLAPAQPLYRYQRAKAYAANDQLDLALADADQGLKLKPDDVDLLLLRAVVRVRKSDLASVAELAVQDFDAADRAAAPSADIRSALGSAYSEAIEATGNSALYARALKQFDLWIKYHPDDEKLPSVLNGRCWLGAITGQALARSLEDCNRSLRMRPKMANVLDSRGLVQLRLGAIDRSIADYDLALAANPKAAMSLYGRGIAKARKGDAGGAKADIAAALAINPDSAKRFGNFGLPAPVTAGTE
jgi:tetratricopeptide (TPR) repeat protein